MKLEMSLEPVIVQALARMIQTLRSKGYTVVMVEQNFRFAAPLANRFYVMEHGRRGGRASNFRKLPVLRAC
jgi:branched-chain amino acid transport system ATP-binding protein